MVYSLMAFVFLVLVAHFRVKSIWALFLVGATFGWIDEGIVVQTAYDMLPLSVSFTGLAWHALLTVWVGWYALRKSLISSDAWSTLKLAAAVGVCYGLWAINWWFEPDGGVSSVPEFAAYSFITTAILIPAYWLVNWSASEPFVPNRWVIVVVSGIFALYFGFVTVPAAPLALVILPLLFGLIYLALRRNRLAEDEGSLLDAHCNSIPVWKYISLLALPLTGILVYALATALQLQWQTNWVLYLVTTPLGFVLFAVSLVKVWRRQPAR